MIGFQRKGALFFLSLMALGLTSGGVIEDSGIIQSVTDQGNIFESIWTAMLALVILLVCTVMVVIPVLLVAASFITEGLSVYQKLQEGRLDPSEYIATFREGFPLAYH